MKTKLFKIIMFAAIGSKILSSCTKESGIECKECYIRVDYNSPQLSLSGSDSSFTDCQNPEDKTTEESAVFYHRGYEYQGTKRTIKRCE